MDHYSTGLSGFLDFEVLELEHGYMRARMPLRDDLMVAAGEFLHGGTVVAFADTCTGLGCLASLPDGKTGFGTLEMKVNLVGSAHMTDALVCEARMLHGGRGTQVWDAAISRERDGRAIAHFRCTQHLD
jgi:uncharacterized protein (TIGR00369 family)